MNKSELNKILQEHGVPQDFYSLTGGHPNDCYCLHKSGYKWFVYYTERGLEIGTKEFISESDACEYLLKLILEDEALMSYVKKNKKQSGHEKI